MEISRDDKEVVLEQPAFLSQEETENPFLVIHNLVDYCSLFDIREAWWDILYYMIASKEVDGLDAATRAQYLFIHKAMLKLAESAFLIERFSLHSKMEQLRTLKTEA